MKLTFTEITHPQRSPEWFAARAGRLTGSAASAMTAEIKSGEAAARRDLRVKLALEQLTGQPIEDEDLSKNVHVQRGVELEPFARMALEARLGAVIRETGFLSVNEMLMGCSLDGDMGNFEEVVEIKCPKPAIHIGYLTDGRIPRNYLWQCAHNVLVTGAKGCHFFSYCEGLPGSLGEFHVYAKAEDLPIAEYFDKAQQFLNEVGETRRKLEALSK